MAECQREFGYLLWVKPEASGISASRPLKPRKRNSKWHSAMSQSCQNRTCSRKTDAYSITSSARANRARWLGDPGSMS